MLDIEVHPGSGRYDVRGYLVVQSGHPSTVMVDPTEEAIENICASLERHGTSLEYVILTHEHCDHITGVEALRGRFGSKLVCSRACSELIQSGTGNLSRYLIQRDIVCGPADIFTDELPNGLEWADRMIRFVPTPGHSPGSHCIELDGMLFTGDTILLGLKTVTKLPGGDRTALAASIDKVLSSYPPETRVLPGHGAAFCLGEMRRNVILGEPER